MRIVKFENRRAVPRGFRVGVEMDNNVAQVQFELPHIADNQIETLFWRNGAFADAVLLENGLWTITDAITRHPGQALCYISISDGAATLWHSEVFAAYVCDLPGTEYQLDRTYPSAIQSCIDAASRAVATATSAAEAAAGGTFDALRDAYVSGGLLQTGRVFQTLRPPHFELWYLGHALMADNGALVVQPAENWDMYRYAFGRRLVLRVDQLVKNAAIQGVLPMAYELESTYYPLDYNEVGETIVADALLINCMNTTRTVRTGVDGDRATLAPDDFELWYTGHALMAENGQATVVEAASWDMYRRAFPARTTLRVDQLAKNAAIQGVLPMAYELDSTYHALDLNEVGTSIVADALLTSKLNTTDQFAMTSITYTPYAAGTTGGSQRYSIDSVTYMPIENASETTVTTRQFSIESVSFTADVRRDFENAVVCSEHMGEFDSVVCFGDSIFYGRMQQNGGQVIEQGNGVMQQFASLINLPLNNFAVSGATLSAMAAEPKNVVQQVMDWVPEPGKTPLVIINGGTNDQVMWHLLNMGRYGDEDASTIHGAVKAIVNMLLVKGIQPWQIVITTPIPKGIQGDAVYVANIDAQLTAVGYAMYQTGVAMHCSVINGYHSVFANLDSVYPKRILMEDDTHPTEIGATYYAHYLFDALNGSAGRLARSA